MYSAGQHGRKELLGRSQMVTHGSSIKSQVLDLKTLPIFSPLKISVSKVGGGLPLKKKGRSLVVPVSPPPDKDLISYRLGSDVFILFFKVEIHEWQNHKDEESDQSVKC